VPYGNSSLNSDYSLSDPSSHISTFSSENSTASDLTEDFSMNSAPMVERQDGTSISSLDTSLQLLNHYTQSSPDFELFVPDDKITNLSLLKLKYGDDQNTIFNFYKLMNREVISPEDVEEEDADRYFQDLIFNKTITNTFSDAVLLVGDRYYSTFK